MSMLAELLNSYGIPFNFTTLSGFVSDFILPLILLTIAFKFFMNRYISLFEGAVGWVLSFIISFSTVVFMTGSSIFISAGSIFFIGYSMGGIKGILLGVILAALYYFAIPIAISYIPQMYIDI